MQGFEPSARQSFLQFRERSSITSARLGGVGGLGQLADDADGGEGGWGV